jgi:hypothetical protein
VPIFRSHPTVVKGKTTGKAAMSGILRRFGKERTYAFLIVCLKRELENTTGTPVNEFDIL